MPEINPYPHFPFKKDPTVTLQQMIDGTCPVVCDGAGEWHESLCIPRAYKAWEILANHFPNKNSQ